MNCVMCDHDIDTNVCGFVIENGRAFCSGDDHDCLTNFNQAGLYGYPDTSELTGVDGEPHLLTVERRLSGELPPMEPAEFARRMAGKVARLQRMFPGTKIVLGTAAPLEEQP